VLRSWSGIKRITNENCLNLDRETTTVPSLSSRNLQACHSIADRRSLAQRRLPKVTFEYIDGAAEDELMLGRNNGDFAR
jgi:hypothetical protein